MTVSGVLPEERARKPSAKASQRSLVVLFYLFALCVLVPSCSSQQNIPPSPTSDFLDWSANTRREKTRLCVLPFEDANPPDGLAAIVRERVAGHLSVKRYTDIELHVIDTILEKMDLGSWRELAPSALGMKLGCDALVYGRVQKLQRIYVGIYSQLALEGTVQVVDVVYGKTLVLANYTTRFHDAGIPFSPVDIAASAVRNLMTFTETQLTRVIDDLSRNLAIQVPDLPEVLDSGLTDLSEASPVSTGREDDRFSSSAPLLVGKNARREHSLPYRVQVASFGSYEEARETAETLRIKGYSSAIARVVGKDREWHRIIIGPFPSAKAAYKVGLQIKEQFPFNPIVSQGPLPAP